MLCVLLSVTLLYTTPAACFAAISLSLSAAAMSTCVLSTPRAFPALLRLSLRSGQLLHALHVLLVHALSLSPVQFGHVPVVLIHRLLLALLLVHRIGDKA